MNDKLKVGIRHEDKYLLERRVPLPPHHVKRLINEKGLNVFVEKSDKRAFGADEYINAGAVITEDLKECPFIMGVKEISADYFEQGKTYMFFSHVIKGQPYNMPMLKRMMELECNLIDYECIADETGKRLIFFGRYAGIAGMINSLWSIGQRYLQLGIITPFADIKQAHKYNSLREAGNVISNVGHKIAAEGLPSELLPFTLGFTGYGNVSAGAQEICGLLPVKEITPAELISLKDSGKYATNIVYKVIFREEDISEPIESSAEFELNHYYSFPHLYRSVFEKYVPFLSVLMNCMFWSAKFPRLITKSFVKELFRDSQPKLTVIGDISCDPDGSIEFTHKGTEIQDPVFVYNPDTEMPSMGFAGKGILVMAVDILPSELPRESSMAFGDMLLKYIEPIAKADFSVSYDLINLPSSVKRALILHNGKLTDDYKYLEKYLV